MLAKIEKGIDQYTVTYERHLNHPIEEVWAMLTDNEKLARWFDELRVGELGVGGYLNFDMGDGTFERMDITDYQDYSVLEFTWDADQVRFELTEEKTGCQLVLIENVTKITDHTPKDLAGWHVCLDVITTLLDHKEIHNRMGSWEIWYKKYEQAIKELV